LVPDPTRLFSEFLFREHLPGGQPGLAAALGSRTSRPTCCAIPCSPVPAPTWCPSGTCGSSKPA
jgi:hypothetical protein